jgi:hypothetical protein
MVNSSVKAAAQKPRRRETKRLAVLLGASTSRHFPPSHAAGTGADGIRLKLLMAAIALLALCLWGLWHEFF